MLLYDTKSATLLVVDGSNSELIKLVDTKIAKCINSIEFN